MHISGEGTIGIVLALIALAGAGAIMLWPNRVEIGWGLIGLAAVGLAALIYYHLWQAGEVNKMIALAGMVVSGFCFIGFGAWYFLSESLAIPSKPVAAAIEPVKSGTASIPANGDKAEEKKMAFDESGKKPIAQSGGTTVGPVTIQPGAAASFGQQGGQTANTIINHGPPPLSIGPQQSSKLTTAVQPFVGKFSGRKIDISMHNPTSESAALGGGIASSFEKAGFSTNAGVVSFIGAVIDRGVTIRFGKNQEPLAIAVRDALLANGVVVKVYASKGINDDDFLIIIGP